MTRWLDGWRFEVLRLLVLGALFGMACAIWGIH